MIEREMDGQIDTNISGMCVHRHRKETCLLLDILDCHLNAEFFLTELVVLLYKTLMIRRPYQETYCKYKCWDLLPDPPCVINPVTQPCSTSSDNLR